MNVKAARGGALHFLGGRLEIFLDDDDGRRVGVRIDT